MSTSSFWDSCSTLGDHEDSSSSRWDHEEVPAFPLPFSTMVAPKLPQRQRTLDAEDMIGMMMISDDTAIAEQQQEGEASEQQVAAAAAAITTTEAARADQRSASTPSNEPGAISDCPKQQMHMAPPKLPIRQQSRTPPSSQYGDRTRLARMRFQSLVKANTYPIRGLRPVPVVAAADETDVVVVGVASARAPERSTGFYDIKRASTL